jgi:TetR/AcrR family transcriptional regulator, cholesterol catabolism regulator
MAYHKRPQGSRSLTQRKKLLTIAGRLFWQKGYLATSIDDIAKAAKMNKASIYYYFKNKADVLYELASATMQALIDQALPIMNSNLRPEEKLETFVVKHLKFGLIHLGLSGIGQMERRNLPPKLLQAYIRMRDEYEGIFRKILGEGIEQGKFQCRDVKLSSLFMLGFLNSTVQWFNKTGKLSPEEIASEAFAFVSNTLRIEAGLRPLNAGRKET